MSNIANLRDTIVPKSDQLNAEQLISGPMTITVTDVRRGSDDQPLIINYLGDNGRPFKPCKTMRKVLIFAWGEDGRLWPGRSMTIYNNPEIMFGGMKVGGIRISHMTDIDSDIQISLTSTKGKKAPVVIRRLDLSALATAAAGGMKALQSAWASMPADLRAAMGNCPEGIKEIARGAAAPKTEEVAQ